MGRQLRQSWRVAAFDLWFPHNPLFRSRREARQSHGCRNTNHLGCTVLSRGWYTLRKTQLLGRKGKSANRKWGGGGEKEESKALLAKEGRNYLFQVWSIIHISSSFLEKIFSTSPSFKVRLSRSPSVPSAPSVYMCLPMPDRRTAVICGCSCMTSYPFPECLTGRSSDTTEHDIKEPRGLGLNGAKHLGP